MNPYKVLGVDESSTKEEIRKAYLDLVKKYHPDKYRDNPLGDLADEKMRDINRAYDTLVSSGSSSSSGRSTNTSGSSNSSYGNVSYMQIRNMLNLNQINNALDALNSIGVHNAEWYFLRGVCLQKKGMYSQSQQMFNTAVQMDPASTEYRRAANNMSSSNSGFRAQSNNMRPAGGCSICDVCFGMALLDCLCNCC